MIRSTLLTTGFLALNAHAQSSEIICWGDLSEAHCQPPTNLEFISIKAGWNLSAGLTANGTIHTWGDWGGYGQSPNGSQDFVQMDLSMNDPHGVALRANGTIASWGWSGNGVTSPPTSNNFVMVAAGQSHQIALTTSGEVVGWGNNYYGQSNGPSNRVFTAVDAGKNHNIGLESDGSVYCWGSNIDGESDVPIDLGPCVQVSAGAEFSAVIRTDGSIAAWGREAYGTTDVPVGNDFVKIECGQYHSVALREDGTVACWGYNNKGQSSCTSERFIDVSAGEGHSIGLTIPEPEARCCLGGTCIEMSQIDCLNYGGTDAGEGSCATDTCTSNGACCLPSQCVEVGMQDCFELGGSFAGFGTNCTETQCTFACEGDVSENGTVDFTDLLILINNWGNCPW